MVQSTNERACGCEGACHHGEFPLLRSLFEAPHIRDRIHTICALYYHSSSAAIRRGLLRRLEDLVYEVANALAMDLLDAGWRPEPADRYPGDRRIADRRRPGRAA
jgi:hypothetical protein